MKRLLLTLLLLSSILEVNGQCTLARPVYRWDFWNSNGNYSGVHEMHPSGLPAGDGKLVVTPTNRYMYMRYNWGAVKYDVTDALNPFLLRSTDFGYRCPGDGSHTTSSIVVSEDGSRTVVGQENSTCPYSWIVLDGDLTMKAGMVGTTGPRNSAKVFHTKANGDPYFYTLEGKFNVINLKNLPSGSISPGQAASGGSIPGKTIRASSTDTYIGGYAAPIATLGTKASWFINNWMAGGTVSNITLDTLTTASAVKYTTFGKLYTTPTSASDYYGNVYSNFRSGLAAFTKDGKYYVATVSEFPNRDLAYAGSTPTIDLWEYNGATLVKKATANAPFVSSSYNDSKVSIGVTSNNFFYLNNKLYFIFLALPAYDSSSTQAAYNAAYAYYIIYSVDNWGVNKAPTVKFKMTPDNKRPDGEPKLVKVKENAKEDFA